MKAHDFQRLIENNIMRDESPLNKFNRINFILAKEFHWDYKTIMDTPIPFVLTMLDELKKYNQEQKRSIR